jgi:hypothetical protein
MKINLNWRFWTNFLKLQNHIQRFFQNHSIRKNQPWWLKEQITAQHWFFTCQSTYPCTTSPHHPTNMYYCDHLFQYSLDSWHVHPFIWMGQSLSSAHEIQHFCNNFFISDWMIQRGCFKPNLSFVTKNKVAQEGGYNCSKI